VLPIVRKAKSGGTTRIIRDSWRLVTAIAACVLAFCAMPAPVVAVAEESIARYGTSFHRAGYVEFIQQ